ncbi:tetratricopeptide repeat protein [Fontisphaera persica]|uniref:tetratricopeptide repeat protein n=1 Tax=Fontisphaera persica TaxID=2974023 RepID=UPI0024C07E44|nr:tetratricopeptide repeat protein [Fontisphaera persica]WCJ59898.1 tetratricopeptide repeat protein [Fontisphaera persica]
MKSLDPADALLANAALGWLELGNAHEAKAELERLSPGAQKHPVILELQWRIAHELADWQTALALARQQIQADPIEPAGYIHQAYALRRVKGGGLEKALHALLPAARLFPELDIVPYNLACYAAQLGRLEEAWDWLLRAFRLTEDATHLTSMALKDDDLRPLWPKIRTLTQIPGKKGKA